MAENKTLYAMECIECFALRKGVGCDVIKPEFYKIYKRVGGCPFFKTKEQARKDWEKANLRLAKKGMTIAPPADLETSEEVVVSTPWWLFK